MVFSSRGDRRLALSRHRFSYSLLELRQAELAFDDDVAAEVLRRIAGVATTPATVTSVMDTTEGWAAGVQLTRHQPASSGRPGAVRPAARRDRPADLRLPERGGARRAVRGAPRSAAAAVGARSDVTGTCRIGARRSGRRRGCSTSCERDSMFLVAIDDAPRVVPLPPPVPRSAALSPAGEIPRRRGAHRHRRRRLVRPAGRRALGDRVPPARAGVGPRDGPDPRRAAARRSNAASGLASPNGSRRSPRPSGLRAPTPTRCTASCSA